MRTAPHTVVTLLPLSCPAKTVSHSMKGGGMWLVHLPGSGDRLGLVFFLSRLPDGSFVQFSTKAFGQLQEMLRVALERSRFNRTKV